jgi:hypothetical protein
MSCNALDELTPEQVREIADEFSIKFRVESRGTYYTVTDRRTNYSTIENKTRATDYKSHMFITSLYLKKIGKNMRYLDQRDVGRELADARRGYLYTLKRKVVTMLSGFEF